MGQITYRAIGGVQGRKDVPIVVSDGTADGPGIARYDIRPLGTTVPPTPTTSSRRSDAP
jgi:hypothetical protein